MIPQKRNIRNGSVMVPNLNLQCANSIMTKNERGDFVYLVVASTVVLSIIVMMIFTA